METSYKEKYEQAIERLKQWDREHPCGGFVLSYRDKFIFPELAESEDEKVRKEIINYFQCQSEEEPTRKEIHDKWIAWLENIPYTIDHEKREGFHLGYKARLEKQNEQKPTNSYCQDCTNRKGCVNCENGELRETEQKTEENKGNIGGISSNSEWSEEDETGLTNTIIMLKEGASLHFIESDITKAVVWLQSIKDRVQPKQEWGEEDEHRIKDTVYFLDTAKKHYASTEELDACIAWLESLKGRVRPQWKPSYNELEVLRLVAEKDGTCLMGLYEQLKKLKED